VLFDVYETLVDVGDVARARALDELSQSLGLDLEPGELFERRRELLGGVPLRFDDGPFRPFQDRWADDGERLLSALGHAGAGVSYVDAWNRLHACAPPFDDVGPALTELRRHYRLGVIADADTIHLAPCLRATGGTFDAVVCSEEVRAYKPGAEPFLRACELVGAPPKECVFVGDRPEADIGGAAGVGMRTVWINRRNHTWPTGLPPPDATITTLAELPATVRALA
jgi:putative hydrolase of the HAD superfamily